MNQSYCYSFRFCCDPGFNDRREIASLRRFVREAQIDDVAVFCNVEELNTGHMTEEEQETIWLRLLCDVQAALAPEGVQLSVNHWHSLMHADLGKTLPQSQPFRRMVDMDGREADLCVCPMCERWQTYFAGLYARYAALSPHILWVEDDFRLHNHDPLRWGGCFCPAHMREYARRAGKPELTRGEFVRGILQPGAVHPYRKIWLDVNRETMTALAARIGQAVRQASPTAKVGLMSSVPYIHAAEGRDWYGILRGLAAGLPPVSRIHLPAYQETAPGQYLLRFNMVSMHNRALLPPETEVYPELENYPYSLFAKSRAFTRFQLLSSLPLNLKGMTIDLFDLNGSGIVFSDGYQQMLRAVKPFLNAVNAMDVFALPKRGVCVMTSEDSAYTLQTAHGTDMEELYPHEVYFAGLLNAMGIAYQYCTDPGVSGQVVAVSGQYFRNLTPEQIAHLFAHNTLLLSGDAVDTLCQMGLGELAGVRSCRWMRQNSGAYTYEQVVNGKAYLGLPQARASAVISSTDVLQIDYLEQPELYTEFFDSFRRPAAPGHAVSRGRVLIHPFGRFSSPGDMPPMQLNALRRELLQDMLASRLDAPMVAGQAYLQPYCTCDGRDLYLYLVNGSMDEASSVTLAMGALRFSGAWVLTSRNERRTIPYTEGPDGRFTFDLRLAPMDAALLCLTLQEEEPA